MHPSVKIHSLDELRKQAKGFSFKNRDFISIQDFSKDELMFLVHLSIHIKYNFDDFKERFAEKHMRKRDLLGLIFGEPSTRTRMSSKSAALHMGYTTADLVEDGASSRAKGEKLKHEQIMLMGYHHKMIVMRQPLEGVPLLYSMSRAKLAAQREKDGLPQYILAPLINAGDGAHQHPTQTLLDLMTVYEYKGTFDVPFSIIGDARYSRVVNSLIQIAPIIGIPKFIFVAPEAFQPSESQEQYLKLHNISFEKTQDITYGLQNAQVADVSRFQLNRIEGSERDALQKMIAQLQDMIQVAAQKLDNAHPELIVLHPLPIDKNVNEITDDADFHPKAKHFAQSQNGLYARMALMTMIAGDIESREWAPASYVHSDGELKELPIGEQDIQHRRYAVGEMEEGMSVDHILRGSGRHVLRYFNKKYPRHKMTIGLNFESPSREGEKDIVKIFKTGIDKEDVNALGLRAGGCTLNIIKNGKVIYKCEPIPGDTLFNLLECTNKKCVTNPEYKEGAETIHVRVGQDPETKKHLYKCAYCDAFSDRWKE